MTCWSRQPLPHLESRQYSVWPQTQQLLSGEQSRPVAQRYTQRCKDDTSANAFRAAHGFPTQTTSQKCICSMASVWEFFLFHSPSVNIKPLTRKDQMFMRPPTPPDTRARPSGLNTSILTGVMWPLSWKTHTAPSSDHGEDCNNTVSVWKRIHLSPNYV